MTILVTLFILLSILYAFQLYYQDNLPLKMVSVAILFIISSTVYFSFDTYKGWPASGNILRGYLRSTMVVEPVNGKPGEIFVWIIEKPVELTFFQALVTYKFPEENAPRGYTIPYSDEAAKTIKKAQSKVDSGMVVEIGSSQNDLGDPNGDNDSISDGDIHLRVVPPDQILKKMEPAANG